MLEIDEDILTFDVSDDALERAAPLADGRIITLAYCTWDFCNAALPTPWSSRRDGRMLYRERWQRATRSLSIKVSCFPKCGRPANFDLHVATVDPAQLLDGLLERHHGRQTLGRVARRHIRQHADAPHPLGLLRTRGERPCNG